MSFGDEKIKKWSCNACFLRLRRRRIKEAKLSTCMKTLRKENREAFDFITNNYALTEKSKVQRAHTPVPTNLVEKHEESVGVHGGV